jgi:hypothetical protein
MVITCRSEGKLYLHCVSSLIFGFSTSTSKKSSFLTLNRESSLSTVLHKSFMEVNRSFERWFSSKKAHTPLPFSSGTLFNYLPSGTYSTDTLAISVVSPDMTRVGNGISFRKNSETRNGFRYSAEESPHSEAFRVPRNSQFRSSERNGTEWNSAEKISFTKQQQKKLKKMICLYIKSRLF